MHDGPNGKDGSDRHDGSGDGVAAVESLVAALIVAVSS